MNGRLPRLECDASGDLRWIDTAGRLHPGVHLVQAFPLTAPGEQVSVVSADGAEIDAFERLDGLDPALRAAIEAALAEREFMPVIEQVLSASRHWVPSILEVETDRGQTQLALETEEAIRRIGADNLLIRDRRGIFFVVEHHSRLDRRSRKLLERFL